VPNFWPLQKSAIYGNSGRWEANVRNDLATLAVTMMTVILAIRDGHRERLLLDQPHWKTHRDFECPIPPANAQFISLLQPLSAFKSLQTTNQRQ